MVDHAEEHTIGMILDNGFWTGVTLYPVTKTSPGRAVDMIERYGTSASAWPLPVTGVPATRWRCRASSWRCAGAAMTRR